MDFFRELHKNATSYIEPILDATPHKNICTATYLLCLKPSK